MTFPRGTLVVTGLGFIGFGLAYALWPLPMARLTEIPLPTATARIDFAATYGGFQLGFGLFLLGCARREPWTQPGLWAATAALTGLALMRLQGLVAAGGQVAPTIWVGLALEAGAALLNAIGLHRCRRAAAPSRGSPVA